jgi:glycosyltransferase involved in cell wall biosynthesis
LIVLGMHRSGTSAVTGALAHMGIHVGAEEELTPKSWENPSGFFERRDARKICDTLLHRSNADWWKVSAFHTDNANHEAVRAQRPAIRDLIARLDEHGTWVLKEPRLCVLLPIFKHALVDPTAVITIRHPIEIALSLRRRNGFPLQAGLALWEAYTVSLLRESWGIDRIFVDFHALTRDPQSTLSALRDELTSRGIVGLELRPAVESVQPSLHRERFAQDLDGELLSAAQAALWKELKGERAWRTPPQLTATAISVLREFEADEAARAEARSSIKNLTAKVVALEKEQTETKAAAQRHAARAAETDKRMSELATELEKLKRDGQARIADLAPLQSETERLRAAIQSQTQAWEKDRTEIGALRERVASECRINELLRADLSARGSEISAARVALGLLEAHHAEKTELLRVEGGRVERLQTELSARDSEMLALRGGVTDLKELQAKQEERLAVEGRRVEQLNAELSIRSAESTALATALEELKRQDAVQKERILLDSRRIEQLNVTLAACNAELHAERREMQELRNELVALERQSTDRGIALSELEGRHRERGERLAAHDELVEELRRQVAAELSEVAQLRAELNELHERFAEQSRTVALQNRSVQELSDALSARDSQVETSRVKIAELERSYREQSERLGEERTRVERLHIEVGVGDSRLSEQEAELDNLRRRYAEKSERLDTEAVRAERLLAEVRALGSLVSELRTARDAGETEISELRAARDAGGVEITNLRADLSSVSSQFSELDYRHKKQSERLDDVIRRLKAERKKSRRLDRQLTRATTQQANIGSLIAEKSAVEDRLAAIQLSRGWRLISFVTRLRRRLLVWSRETRAEDPHAAESRTPPQEDRKVEVVGRAREIQPIHPPVVSTAEPAAVVKFPAATTLGGEIPAPKPQRRAESAPKGKLPITALVLTWDIGHNPLGRSYMLAEVVDRVVRHTVIAGFQFPRYGKSIWEPLRASRLPVIRIPGQEFPEFIDTIDHIANVVRPDVVIACKPRLPSLQLGLRIKERAGCPLILDIDDHELSFFKDQTPLTLEAIEAMQAGALRESIEPYGQTWTRLAEGLLEVADAKLVSNTALQQRFGGHLVPHVRDETVFDPNSIQDRSEIRRRFGIPTESKVLMFFGTPRQHKGIGALAEAVGQISDHSFRLVVVGRAPDRSVTAMLDAKAPGRVIQLPNQPFSAIPEILACADVVALPQEVDHPVSLYQLPAKAIDAIAMGVPLLVSRTPPLMDLVRHGVATLVAEQDLVVAIENAARNGMARAEKDARRARFLLSYSYEAAAAQMRDVIAATVRAGGKPMKQGSATRLSAVERKVLGLQDERSRNRDAGHDVVLFWKQNDTTLYGRRHDMIIKYLASRPDTRRILVFDAPISIHQLLQFRDETDDLTQHRQVYVRTEEKLLGLRDQGKVRYRVFAYQPGVYGRGPALDGRLSLSDAYMKFVERTLEAESIDSRQSVFWFYPKNEFIPRIIETFKPHRSVVDVVDDHRAWPNVSRDEVNWLTDHYREVLSLADAAFANCKPVCASMRQFFPGIQLIPNGCDIDSTVSEPNDSPEFEQLKGWSGKVIGFVGNLEKKIDVELLNRIAVELPACLLVLAGSTHANRAVRTLKRHRNVLMPGVVPYENVGAWIKRFDVAIIPHLRSSLTNSMNPLKLFVYAAHQVPVVSTDIPNLDDQLTNLFVAPSHNAFVEQIRSIVSGRLRLIGSPDYGQKNSWASRLGVAVDAVFESPSLQQASGQR